jgi:hypothetical protein
LWCCTLGGVFRFSVFADRVVVRAAMTAASALLNSAPLSASLSSAALNGARR